MTTGTLVLAFQCCLASLALTGNATSAAPPELYRQPAYESPVRADPDDLLLLPGYGFASDDQVVYQAVKDSTKYPVTPTAIPGQSTPDFGIADVVSVENIPYSLTIKLPQSLRLDQSYALWVRTHRGEWSRPILINDARPLWFTPTRFYATESVASLPRQLKVIGRNLQPAPGRSTRIKLIGPQTYEGQAISDEHSSATIDHYVARLALPARVAPGRYRVALSRDGVSWLQVPDQQLDVLPDPSPVSIFSVADPQFGSCRADDGLDDAPCIVRAIAAAAKAGGGTVYFPPGAWDLIQPTHTGLAQSSGIVVPEGVAVLGAGSASTRLIRHSDWSAHGDTAAFTLGGQTQVSGFSFHDLKLYAPNEHAGPFLQLGEDYAFVAASAHQDKPEPVIRDVVIKGNIFDRVYVGIGAGALPIQRLFITYNTFGAYYSAIELGGNQFNMTYKYRIVDSVIDYNTFKPGSRLDLKAKTGTMASELGAGLRLDFSANTADGTSTDYLYAPDDPRGWRAAFFWNMNGNFEKMLVSQNQTSCTGDKIGDGEAIAYDNNTNTFAFATAPAALKATSTTVVVSAPLARRQNNRNISTATYYIGHWLQIVSGPGVGQVRRIVSYATNATSHMTTFRVAPDWDVVPVAGATRIAVGREFWQVYTIDNSVEHGRPPCLKSNRSRHDGGVIGMYAQSADSVIEGNMQHDTDGILVEQAYILPEHTCPDCTMSSVFQDFLEIRGNTIDGEYDWDTDCSDSGIVTAIAASPAGDSIPPTLGYGISISHNTVRHADAEFGGAIAQTNPWYAGPEPGGWPLSDNQLIHHNVLEDIDGPRAVAICGRSLPRIGINFPPAKIAWRSVLYANRCTRVSQPLAASGMDTVRVCPSQESESCECPRP